MTLEILLQREPSDKKDHLQATVTAGVVIAQATTPKEVAEALGAGADIVVLRPSACPDDTDGLLITELPRALGAVLHEADTFTPIRDIRFDPERAHASVAMSLHGHRAHTDGTFQETPPRWFVLEFKQTDPTGGTSLAWSVDRLLHHIGMLGDEHLEVMRTQPVRWFRKDPDGRDRCWEAPLVGTHADGTSYLRYRNDEQVVPEPVGTDAEATQRVISMISNWMATAPRAEITTRRGDLLVINNSSVLHGRCPLASTTSPRWARRTWYALGETGGAS